MRDGKKTQIRFGHVICTTIKKYIDIEIIIAGNIDHRSYTFLYSVTLRKFRTRYYVLCIWYLYGV